MPEGPDLFDEGEISVGAQTTVRLAFDRQLLRQVVVKSLRPELHDDAAARARLLEEAQITGQLEHPGIPAVYAIGEQHGLPFFSMKKVAGVNLEQVLRHPDFDLGQETHRARALDALLRTCDALAYAHHRGILHLDLKPSNVMVGPGVVDHRRHLGGRRRPAHRHRRQRHLALHGQVRGARPEVARIRQPVLRRGARAPRAEFG
jgi:serine/threonine protein kinase